MALLDIDKIVNEPHHVTLNGRVLYVREFTVRERIDFARIMGEEITALRKKQETDPSFVLTRLKSKDIGDYKLLDFIFKTGGVTQSGKPWPDGHVNDFSAADFDVMNNSQVVAITDLVFVMNDFFGRGKKEEVETIPEQK